MLTFIFPYRENDIHPKKKGAGFGAAIYFLVGLVSWLFFLYRTKNMMLLMSSIP